MPFRLCFLDPVDHTTLDEHDLLHCADEATARRWLAAQASELVIELRTDAGVLAVRSVPPLVRS